VNNVTVNHEPLVGIHWLYERKLIPNGVLLSGRRKYQSRSVYGSFRMAQHYLNTRLEERGMGRERAGDRMRAENAPRHLMRQVVEDKERCIRPTRMQRERHDE
jgi:hypothetical protein